MPDERSRIQGIASHLHDPRSLDPKQELVSTSGMDDAEVGQIVRVLDAIRAWRDAEQRISFESRSNMQLGENDMKALRFLVLCKNQNIVATPGALAEHLAISSAATAHRRTGSVHPIAGSSRVLRDRAEARHGHGRGSRRHSTR